MKRVLTALLLIPAVVWLIFAGPNAGVLAALTLVGLLCLHECLALVRAGGTEVDAMPAYAAGALAIVIGAGPHAALLIGFAMLLAALGIRRVAAGKKGVGAAAATLFAVVYSCGPFALAWLLHTKSPHWMFVVLAVNWAGDSAAYYAGRAFGKHKLAPVVSPGKTWEGTIASAVFGTAVGAGYLTHFAPAGADLPLAIVFSAAVNAAGQLGDLAESAMKRSVGVKDSGTLLPGHGGIMDRLDSLLPSAFIVWAVLTALL